MNDKVTLQAISDIFATQYGISKKTTDAFGKSFFDTIVDGLNQDGQVKIKGLGTFKIVSVGSRESVNVTNGERIVIEGYKKVSFVPEDIVELKKEEVKQEIETAVAAVEQETIPQSEKVADQKIDVNAELQKVENEAKTETETMVAEETVCPEEVEMPKDELSGIDMVIATPESVEELQKDVEAAKVRAEETLEQAKNANIEYRRLQLLLDRLINNQVSESDVRDLAKSSVAMAVEPSVEPVVEDIPVPSESAGEIVPEPVVVPVSDSGVEEDKKISEPVKASLVKDREKSHEEVLQRYLNDEEDEDDDEEEEEGGHKKLYAALIVALILLGGIAYYLYANSKPKYVYDLSEDDEELVEENKDTTTAVATCDTLVKDSNKVAKPELSATEKAKAEIEQKDADAKKLADAQAAERLEADKKAAEAKKPRTHTMVKGESLTRISQKYYGTKDSVNAIIRVNNFKDPNNVPYGVVVKLP